MTIVRAWLQQFLHFITYDTDTDTKLSNIDTKIQVSTICWKFQKKKRKFNFGPNGSLRWRRGKAEAEAVAEAVAVVEAATGRK